MDATATYTELEAPEPSSAVFSDAVAPSGRPRRRQYKKPATPANDPVPVVSHLTGDEPVTRAEIELVLAFLRDSIADIMRDEI